MTAFGGKSTGEATLNGKPLTVESFNTDCFVVTQQDNHWPFLTCYETVSYAAQLYLGKDAAGVKANVDSVVKKMGLESCQNTRVGNMFIQGLSGGQKRRLSIALALIKQPTLMFFDEPTSGLDAAAAANIMREITTLAQEENLCIVATIHQPSSKVYQRFDQIMILSGGREAFCGTLPETKPYFESLGYPLIDDTNPAEYFLDLVNNVNLRLPQQPPPKSRSPFSHASLAQQDFVEQAEVDKILDSWAETKASGGMKSAESAEKLATLADAKPLDSPRSALLDKKTGICHEMECMMRRHALLVARDPILYIGRAMIFLMSNLYFSAVYIEARTRTQDQVLNRMWLCVWYIGVPANMGVVAVYALNEEYKSIAKEIKNGMVSPYSYVLAKTLLEIPIMFFFAFAALGISAYGIMNFEPAGLGMMVLTWTASIYCFEAMSESLAVAFDNPLLGMMQFMGIWFSAFLYGGFLIPGSDMIWPLKIFFYIMPMKYTIRTMVYSDFIHSEYDSCDKNKYEGELCFGQDGDDVLDNLGKVMPLITSKDHSLEDIMILLAMAVFYKLIYVVILITKSRAVTTIVPAEGKGSSVQVDLKV